MYLAPAGAWAGLRFGCLRNPSKAPLHLLSHAHAHTCTSHGMHGMAAHLNHAAHRRSALRRAAMRRVPPALPRARLLLASACLLLARDRYQFAGLYGTTCAVHVLCMCCACVVHVLCYAVLCCAVHVLCSACACASAVHALCMCYVCAVISCVCAVLCCAVHGLCCACPVHMRVLCTCCMCSLCMCMCYACAVHAISLETVALKNASVSTSARCSRMTPSTSPYIRKQYVPLCIVCPIDAPVEGRGWKLEGEGKHTPYANDVRGKHEAREAGSQGARSQQHEASDMNCCCLSIQASTSNVG